MDCLSWSMVRVMFNLASRPYEIRRFSTSLFSLMDDLSFITGFSLLWLPNRPSGMEEKTVLRLSVRVSLNLSNYFLTPLNFISSLVYSYFYFFMSSLRDISILSFYAIMPFSLTWSSFALARSPCRIYTIFSSLFFSIASLLRSFFKFPISAYSSVARFSTFSLIACKSANYLALFFWLTSLFWSFYYSILIYFFSFSLPSLFLMA